MSPDETAVVEEPKDVELKTLLEGINLVGDINTERSALIANIEHSIRLGYPQVKMQPLQTERVALVGGGPSLKTTERELFEAICDGAKVVALNGAYAWCLEHNIRPSAHVVLDARPENARFIGPAVPQCRYLIASQCHPETWKKVEGRDGVWIWHSMGPESDLKHLLDTFYLGKWQGIPGGTTVAMRAIPLLRTLGFLRMDLFGVDSCWMGAEHHAFAQPENARDKPFKFTVHPVGHPEAGRTFVCSPWHVQQLDDLLQMVRVNGQHFLLNIHGDGLLAYALKSSAALAYRKAEEN